MLDGALRYHAKCKHTFCDDNVLSHNVNEIRGDSYCTHALIEISTESNTYYNLSKNLGSIPSSNPNLKKGMCEAMN